LQDLLRDPRWLEEAARRHHAVVAAYASIGPTAPLRLATVYRDDDRVRDVLCRRTTMLAAALDTVAGRDEWGVQAYAAAAAAPVPGQGEPTAPLEVTGPGGTRTGRPGTAYLRRRRAEQVARDAARHRTATAVERVHELLSGLAVASVRHTTPGGRYADGRARPVLNASYLVDHDRSQRLVPAVQELEDAHPWLRLRVTGPWPAYSFVKIGAEAVGCRPR
jgi:hypothetical protein